MKPGCIQTFLLTLGLSLTLTLRLVAVQLPLQDVGVVGTFKQSLGLFQWLVRKGALGIQRVDIPVAFTAISCT